MFRKTKSKLAVLLSLALCVSMMASTNVFAADEESVEGSRFLTFNSAEGDVDTVFIPSNPLTPNYTLPSGTSEFNGVGESISGYNYTSDWAKVTNLSAKPYNAVVQLDIINADGSTGYGTGAIVGDGIILTAAHCLYKSELGGKARSVKISFKKNGGSAAQVYNTTGGYSVPDEWPNASEDDTFTLDYGFITIPKTKTDGYFKFGLYAGGAFVGTSYTIAGFPWKKNVFNGHVMYTDTALASDYYLGSVKHDINICDGVSGAPMYGYNNYIVAIQSRGYSEQFDGPPSGGIFDETQYGGFSVQLTQDVINFILKENQ